MGELKLEQPKGEGLEYEGSMPDSYAHEEYQMRQRVRSREDKHAEAGDNVVDSLREKLANQYAMQSDALMQARVAAATIAILNATTRASAAALTGEDALLTWDVPEGVKLGTADAGIADILRKSKKGDEASEALSAMVPGYMVQQMMNMGTSVGQIRAILDRVEAAQAKK